MIQFSLRWVLAGLIAFAAIGWAAGKRRRIRFIAPLLVAGAGLILLETFGQLRESRAQIREICVAVGAIALVNLIGALVVPLLDRRGFPRLLHDIAMIVAYLVIVGVLLSRLGLNLTGLVATSAVATAAIGLALQDTLGNLASGIALELENSLRPGMWVKTAAGVGRVKTVRLRHTLLEGMFGEKVLVPNLMLTRDAVTIFPLQQRRELSLRVPYGPDPAEILRHITSALEGAHIEGVLATQPPECRIFGFHTDHVEYGIIYYLADPAAERVANSSLLTCSYFALARMGIAMKGVTTIVELNQPRASAAEDAKPRAIELLRQLDLFRPLADPDLESLACRMHKLRFAPGEPIIRQGANEDSMYLIRRGSVLVRVASNGRPPTDVAELHAGDFVGEMSLFTGEPRTATVVARNEVECYRIGKEDLLPVLQNRPQIVEDISRVLSSRREHLKQIHTRSQLDDRATEEGSLLDKMRRFFGL